MSYEYIGDIAGELDIPQDGTLSRVLYRDDRIRVVGFAFDEGQELTEHTASVPAVIEIRSGRISLTLDGDTIEMVPGGWLHMEAKLPHSLRAEEPSVVLLTLLSG